jgi:hypothetical protein
LRQGFGAHCGRGLGLIAAGAWGGSLAERGRAGGAPSGSRGRAAGRAGMRGARGRARPAAMDEGDAGGGHNVGRRAQILSHSLQGPRCDVESKAPARGGGARVGLLLRAWPRARARGDAP